MYGEYQIRAAMLKNIEQALADTEVKGFIVLARSPQTLTNDKNVVMLDKLNTKRHGFQSHMYKRCDSNPDKKMVFWKSEEWIEEITFQISVYYEMRLDDTINTMTGDDVAKRLQMWFNSHHGAAAMRNRKDVPMAPVHVFQTRSQTYSDDSEIHQRDESFDLNVIVLQTWDTEPKHVDDWAVETHPI